MLYLVLGGVVKVPLDSGIVLGRVSSMTTLLVGYKKEARELFSGSFIIELRFMCLKKINRMI
jgi:hypothetical protein